MADHYASASEDDYDDDTYSRGHSREAVEVCDDNYHSRYHDDEDGESTPRRGNDRSRGGSLHHSSDDGDYLEDEGDEGEADGAATHDNPATATLSIGEAILHDVKTSHAAVEQRGRRGNDGKATECCICGARALYTCPGCGRRTCSMTCVRVHKGDFNCTGERDVAAAIPLSEFSDEQLERDFHFLEDCRRVVDNVERSFPRSMWRFTYKALPPPLHALREAARRRGVICQITSEGMQKRDANTSRLDRKTNTIVWRCEFQFVDARRPATEDAVSIATNWGSERHRLGDVMRYCWAINPPLLCYHINRQYNRASKYVGGATAAPGIAEKTEEGGADESTLDHSSPKDAHEEQKTENVTMQSVDSEEVRPNAVAADSLSPEDAAGEAVAAVALEGNDKHNAEGLTSSPQPACSEPAAPLVPLHAFEEAPPMPPIEPVSPEEAAQQTYVNDFLAYERYVILSKAERLGSETKYFQLVPQETLNETLRRLFFVNEFPVFVVVHASQLHRFPLVTEDDKERIRGSFRSRKTHEPREKAPLRRRSDVTPEELERLSKVPCRRFLHGRCPLKEECPYWHCTPEEIPVCRSFLRTGQCDKGPRCSFRHDPDAVRQARKRQRDDGGGRGCGNGGRGGGGRGGGGGGFRGGRGGFRGGRGARRRMD